MKKKEYIKDLASIIVPVYNVEPFLKECLDSIINQTYKNIEILLINNESTDNSGKICDEYAQKDNRVRVINIPHGYVVSFPRNKGISEVRGEYCFFVDSDDWLETEVVEKCIKSFKENPKVNIVAFGFAEWIVSSDNKTWQKNRNILDYDSNSNNIYSGHEVLELLVQWFLYPAPWQRAYRTELIEYIRFIEEVGIVEDGPFFLEVCLNPDVCLITLPYVGYNYRVARPGALSNKTVYLWRGSIIGFKPILESNRFTNLSNRMKATVVLLIASYFRSYISLFYGYNLYEKQEYGEDLKSVILMYRSLLKSYKSYLPYNIDRIFAYIMIYSKLDKTYDRLVIIEKVARRLKIRSLLYVP